MVIAFDVFTEVIILARPVDLIQSLQMPASEEVLGYCSVPYLHYRK